MQTSLDTNTNQSHVAGICHNTSYSRILHTHWVVDSGASAHVCFNRDLFVNLAPVSGISLSLPDHSRITVELVGSVQISADLLLTNVMFVPTFRYNLLSVSALTADCPISAQFSNDYCVSLGQIVFEDDWQS